MGNYVPLYRENQRGKVNINGSELQNLTSRQFLAQKVSLESRYVLSGTKGDKDLIATPLETFRAPVDPGD